MLLMAVALQLVPQAYAEGGRLSDGPEGITCDFFSAEGRLAWARRGGDWIDASGKLHGDGALSTGMAPGTAGQVTELDVSTLLETMRKRSDGFGGLILHYVGPSGTLAYHSRESQDLQARPALEVVLTDGRRMTLAPVADTVLDCSTRRALGRNDTFKLSDNQRAFIEFDLASVDMGKITSAILRLTTQRVWGNPKGEVAVFMAALPGSDRVSENRRGIAEAYPGDRNIQSHPAVFFATGFEQPPFSRGWTVLAKKSLAELVNSADENGFTPLLGNALKVSLNPRQNLGLDLRYDFAKELAREPTEAYMRYYLMFGKNWQPDVDGGKLPGFAGTYNQGGWGLRASDGTNGWSARGAFARQHSSNSLAPSPVAIGSYVYHVDSEGKSGTFWGWNLGPTGMLDTARWYAVEQYVRMNTLGKNDGVFRAWIDGELVFERTDLRFRDVDTLKIETAWFNVYHGGTAKPPREMSLYIDNVVIASEYIGPMAR
ncbi:polysaccharide lyase [Thauera butanivorans]|uniref:polysaccharide lyase n=1 Tax=Thauera butanivorans TaxID=86174 RepID=UPI003AB4C34D